jgi:UDP-glucose 4-epimerase
VSVLVTGGGGALWKALIHTLADGGYEVVSGDSRPLSPEGQGLAEDREVDLSGVGQFVGTMVSCDAVVHLGAIDAPNRHPDERVFRDNVLSAFTVLQAAMLRG